MKKIFILVVLVFRINFASEINVSEHSEIDNVGYFLLFENGEIKFLHRSMKTENILENLLPVDYTEYGIKILEEAMEYIKKRISPNGSRITPLLLIRYLLKYLDERGVLIKENDTSETKEELFIKSIQNISEGAAIELLNKEDYEYSYDSMVVKKQVVKPQIVILKDENRIGLTNTLISVCIGDLKNNFKNQMSNSSNGMLEMALKKIYPSRPIVFGNERENFTFLDGNKFKRLWDFLVNKAEEKKRELEAQ
jgi:hypothetical protein